MKVKSKIKQGGYLTRKTKRIIFSSLVLILPIAQFCIFYIYSHLNMFLLAFQKYSINLEGLGYHIEFAKFDNFKTAWEVLKTHVFMVENSLKLALSLYILGMFFELIFSFYIYKKFIGASLFKVFLFMPHIISSVVISLLFEYMVEDVYVAIVMKTTGKTVEGLFTNLDTRLGTIIFYNVWVSLGVRILMFSSSMANINESIVESAQLDGVNYMQEFLHITFPMIFPTFTTFTVMSMASIFTNQFSLFTFFGYSAGDVSSLGYYIYTQASAGDTITSKAGYLNYSQQAAFGLMLTFVMLPLILTVKHLLEKYGPSTD